MIDKNYIESLVPTKIVEGKGCLRHFANFLSLYGNRALIVAGRSSRLNGSQSDVANMLVKNGQHFSVYEDVTPNPTVACVRRALSVLKETKCDFVIGVGGGSAMDVAKAVALLAVQDRADEDIFKGGYKEEALPLVLVPTTAGTGSEVTPYSILTNDAERTKTNISSPALFPKLAFLDYEYTSTLSLNVTVNTAIDALSHAVEGMFTNRSSPTIDVAALKAIEVIFDRLYQIADEHTVDKEAREDLLLASCLAGAVIAHTGTTIVHSMGYSLTYNHDIPHGRANGILLGSMLALCEKRGLNKVEKILAACRVRSVNEFSDLLARLLYPIENIGDDELFAYAREAAKSKKLPNIMYKPTYADILDMYLTSFSHKK